MVNPVIMRSFLGRNDERVLVPAARAKNARSGEVRWPTSRAFRRWMEVGLFGYGADGVPSPGRAGRLADRNGALAAYRDATLFKVTYDWGLRRMETSKMSGRGSASPTTRHLFGLLENGSVRSSVVLKRVVAWSGPGTCHSIDSG